MPSLSNDQFAEALDSVIRAAATLVRELEQIQAALSADPTPANKAAALSVVNSMNGNVAPGGNVLQVGHLHSRDSDPPWRRR